MLHLYPQVTRRIVGRRREIRLILAALAAGRHLLLEGPPGTSKSTILRAVAEEAGCPFQFVTANSDLTGGKLIGYFDPAQTLRHGYNSEFFVYGPLTAAMKDGALLYIEEFNRLPDETTNVFLTVCSEGQIAVPRLGIVRAAPGFHIVAAMNPYDDTAVYRVSRALRDRFCSVVMDYQSEEEEVEIVRRVTGTENEFLARLAVGIARRTRRHPDVRLGSSVRGAIDMVLIAEALGAPSDNSLLRNWEFLLDAAITAMRDKIWLHRGQENKPEDVLRQIFGEVIDAVPHDTRTAVKKKQGMPDTATFPRAANRN